MEKIESIYGLGPQSLFIFTVSFKETPDKNLG